MTSQIVTANIQMWRQKARDGTLTQEELKLAIAEMRQERVGAGAVSTASKAKKSEAAAKKQPIDSDALLGELGL
jgi:hypothetical protein